MPIVSDAYQAPDWLDGQAPAIDADELTAMSQTLEKIPVANGGTGATTASEARTNLGITPANIGALPTSGGTISGNLTVTGSLTGNLTGNADNIDGVVAIAHGGTGATTVATARNALGLGNTSGALPVSNGGTGATTVAAARNNLGLGNTSGALPVANGGTGATSAATARTNLGVRTITSGTASPSGGSNGDIYIQYS